MPARTADVSSAISVRDAIAELGWLHLPGACDLGTFRERASRFGTILTEHLIAIRPGAHAYVAQPGPVPLHTDHPEAEYVAWFCEAQDADDGATRLLDSSPIVGSLPSATRRALRGVDLWCPPVAGGPPTLKFPVLRVIEGRELVFCSPWLHAASRNEADQRVLDDFRTAVSGVARNSVFEVRLRPGDLLVVDNRRMLHGRGAIAAESPRRLHRLWLSASGRVTPPPPNVLHGRVR